MMNLFTNINLDRIPTVIALKAISMEFINIILF